jgi:hypothetical protein
MLVWCIHGGRCVTCASVNYWWQCRRGQFSGPIMMNMNVAFDTSRLILWGPDYAEWHFCSAMLIMSSAWLKCCQWWCVMFVWYGCDGLWCFCVTCWEWCVMLMRHTGKGVDCGRLMEKRLLSLVADDVKCFCDTI